MKIALIIFPIHSSHGCILQTYALKSKIEDMGYLVDIINRHWDKPSIKYRLKFFVKGVLNRLKGRQLPLLWEDTYQSFKLTELNAFILKYLSPQIVDVYDDRKLEVIDWNRYHALIVGSDQIWRPKYVSNVFNYFLNFAENCKQPLKIAYAASFGTDKWEYNEEQTREAKRLISYFDTVAVREISGVKLCRKYLKKDAIRVLDPTLLFTGDEYIRRLGLKVKSEDILATYYLDSTKGKCIIASKVASYFNCNIIDVNRDMENPNATRNMQVAPSMKEWLETSLSAKYVIVDSFHAMVFAILFHKQFLVIGNIERGLSRFQNVLDAIGLSDRLYFTEMDVIAQINKPVDWELVDEELSKLRTTSVEYLRKSLNLK